MKLVPDAELSKALADPCFRYFDFEDRIITRIIKIIKNLSGAVTDRLPFSELLLREDNGVSACRKEELLLY